MKDQQNQSLGVKLFGHSPETNRNLTRCENLEEGEDIARAQEKVMMV